MKKWRIFLLAVTAIALAACGNDDPRELSSQPNERQEFLMGTLASIRVFNEDKDEAIDAAFNRVEELDNMFAMENPDSEISAVNQAAGVEPVEVSDEVFYVMEIALDYAEGSEGRFDPTIGAVTQLWGIGHEDAAVPSATNLEAALELVDYRLVEMDEENQTIYLPMEGMTLDLGAIAKGYITDEATRILVENDVDTAIIDMGGDIFALGTSTRGPEEPWNVGIQNPFEARGEILGMIPARDEAIVTSGIYERVFEENGESYHHLMNPETGFPFDNEIAGISLVAETALDGDALSTVAFSLGVDDGLEYINSLDNVEAVFITQDRRVFVTEGYDDDLEITDETFVLSE